MTRELEQMNELWNDVGSIELDLKELKDAATDSSAPELDADRVQMSKDVNQLNPVEEYISLERESLDVKRDELKRLINWLRPYLDSMPNKSERNVLSQIYIMHRSPVEVAESLGYSRSHVYKLLRAGEQTLEKMISNATK